jgi:hypothetical protein
MPKAPITVRNWWVQHSESAQLIQERYRQRCLSRVLTIIDLVRRGRQYPCPVQTGTVMGMGRPPPSF